VYFRGKFKLFSKKSVNDQKWAIRFDRTGQSYGHNTFGNAMAVIPIFYRNFNFTLFLRKSLIAHQQKSRFFMLMRQNNRKNQYGVLT
jgi:hypothetical protein